MSRKVVDYHIVKDSYLESRRFSRTLMTFLNRGYDLYGKLFFVSTEFGDKLVQAVVKYEPETSKYETQETK